MLFCIHPEGWHSNFVPGGAPFVSCRLKFFLGNITRGDTKFPPALIQNTTVIRDPRSAEVRLPICRLPLSATTCGIFEGTIDRPLSSTLKTRSAG